MNNKENSNIRRSHSFSDVLSSTIAIENENDLFNPRRGYSSTVSGAISTISPSKTFHIESNTLGNKDSIHNIDYLSTGILRLLTDIALTTPDRLMMKLIDHVFRLNILIVLLLDASMAKRVQCLKLLDIILKRMEREKVQNDVVRADLHTMLANQIYHQLDGHDDENQLVEVCVSIALQRPIEFNIKLRYENLFIIFDNLSFSFVVYRNKFMILNSIILLCLHLHHVLDLKLVLL
jgi:hypothetical protein